MLWGLRLCLGPNSQDFLTFLFVKLLKMKSVQYAELMDGCIPETGGLSTSVTRALPESLGIPGVSPRYGEAYRVTTCRS